jgi:glycosyltransferase involved in cell wall biosynthesis
VVHYYHGSLSKETEHWEDEKSKRIIRDLELSFDRADVRYVFPSTFVLHYVERHVFRHRLRRGQVLVLPNPIPQAFFDAPIPLVKKGVAFVGRWTRIKNTSFVQRFVALNHHEPQPVGVLVVTDAAGKEKASKVLHDKVVFAGPFHGAAEMARFYSEREAVLCPSYFETYGNVAQEAVAAGTPALVSRNMGVAEVFKKIGLEHLIVSFSNPKEVMDLVNEKRIPTITNSARKAL